MVLMGAYHESLGREPFYVAVAITFAASSTGNCTHFDSAI